MMIRERQGALRSTVVLIRISWDKDRKRSAQKVIGSFPTWSPTLPAELAGPDSSLTDGEKAEAAKWIAERQGRLNLASLPSLGRSITREADALASALEDPDRVEAALKGIDHVAIYAAMDRLAKALRKHKLARPVTVKKSSEAQPAPEAEHDQKLAESADSVA
jgi:hypothetical protein